MRLLKQRLKRLLVCFLAVSLLWQPIMAYAAQQSGGFGYYATFVNDSTYIGAVSGLQEGVTYPAGATILADCYFSYEDIESAVKSYTAAQIWEALFYVQEENGMSSAYFYGGFEDNFTKRDTPLAYKLYDKYIDESGEEREVTGWKILKIEEIDEKYPIQDEHGQELTEDEINSLKPIIQIRDGYDTNIKYTIKGFTRRVTNDYNLYVSYKLIQVEPIYATSTVTFDSNGGSECNPKTKELAINDKYAPFPETTREHYNLLGWFTGQDDGTEITEDSTKTTAGDETLYAHWEEYQYTIHFNPNFEPGGGIMPDMTLKYSEEKSLTQNEFTREGYTFLGWNTDKDATSVLYQDQQAVRSLSEENNDEVTLYAIWQSLPTVTFDPNGGSACNPSSKQVDKDARYGDLPETVRDKHTFLGWYTDKDNGTEITEDSIKQDDKDETLYAHWEEYQYTIKFNANGGAGTMADMTLKYSDKTALTENTFTRQDYQFLGWNTDKNATSVEYRDGEKVQSLTDKNNGEVTLYAVWQASLTPATVTFDPNGGTCNEKTRQMYKGGRYSPLPEASWDKHTFLGWYTDKDDGTKITEDSIKQDDKDETLYAHWEEYQYTIKFDANGGAGSMADMTLKYSDKAALTKNAFTKSGYQFKGWNTDKDAVLVKYKDEAEIQSLTGENNGVVTLYAVWQKPTKETPPKNPPEKDTPKKTPAYPSGGNDAPRQSEIVKTYVVQKIENVKTSDSIYIYRYIIMFVIGAGFIFLSYRFKKKQ